MNNKKQESSETNVNVIDVDPGTLLAIVAVLLFVPLVLAGLIG